MSLLERTQIEVVSIKALSWFTSCPLDLGRPELRFDRADNAARHPVLQLEDIVQCAVEAIGPDVRAGGRVDQLAGDAHAVAGFAHAAFEHIAHAKFPRHLLYVDGAALVGETRIAR